MKKPKAIKNEHDLIQFMGRFPDKIIKRKMVNDTGWICATCRTEYLNDKEVPSPCKECGSIFFEKVRSHEYGKRNHAPEAIPG